MIGAVALLWLAQANAQAPTRSPAEEEILVIGERVRNVRFKLVRDRKTKLGSCRITRSSGDPVLDRMACDAAVACMGRDEVSGAAFNACLAPRWKSIAQARREQLRASREANNNAPNH